MKFEKWPACWLCDGSLLRSIKSGTGGEKVADWSCEVCKVLISDVPCVADEANQVIAVCGSMNR